MRTTSALGTLLAAASMVGLGAPARAQLAKQGTYSGSFVWVVTSTVHELEDGHVYTHDSYEGTFFNDAGEGFLHESSWVCPGTTDLVDGRGISRGYCIVTDQDDDQAFHFWEGSVDPTEGFDAQYEWTGGTGKYRGIEGDNTLRASAASLTTPGPPLGIFSARRRARAPQETRSVRAQGEWRLP